MPCERGRQVHRKLFLSFSWLCCCISPAWPMASPVGVQSPQSRDGPHPTDMIYIGAEWGSPCPGPQGKHLASFKYSAYFSNYAFSKSFFFFFAAKDQKWLQVRDGQKRAEFTYCLAVPDETGMLLSGQWTVGEHCLWNAGGTLPCARWTTSMRVSAWWWRAGISQNETWFKCVCVCTFTRVHSIRRGWKRGFLRSAGPGCVCPGLLPQLLNSSPFLHVHSSYSARWPTPFF